MPSIRSVLPKEGELIARMFDTSESHQGTEEQQPIRETTTPRRVREAAPSLSVLVAEAFDIYYGHSLRFADILAYVQANGGERWSEVAVRRTYDAWQSLRKRQRDEERLAHELRRKSWTQLKAYERATASRAEEMHRKRKPGWRREMWFAGQVAAEVSRRMLEDERRQNQLPADDEGEPS